MSSDGNGLPVGPRGFNSDGKSEMQIMCDELSRLHKELEAAILLIESQREGIALLQSSNNLLEKERDELAAKCAVLHDTFKTQYGEIKIISCRSVEVIPSRARAMLEVIAESRKLLVLIDEAGPESEAQADRVFAQFEFDDLRKALRAYDAGGEGKYD